MENDFKSNQEIVKASSVEEGHYGVYIDLDHIQVFESEKVHAITYYVKLDEQQESEEPQEIYNLMYFSHDYETYYVTLFRYDFSQISYREFVIHPDIYRAQLSFLPLNDIENIYENIRFSFSNLNQGLSKTTSNYELPTGLQRLQDLPCAVTMNVPGQVCKGSGEVKHVHGEECSMSGSDRATPGYTYIDTRDCYGAPGSGAPDGHGGGGGGAGGGGSVGSPGGGGSNPSDPNPDTNPIRNFPVKVESIFYRGDLFIGISNGQKETNADWIKKMDQNQDFVTKLNELKNASTQGFESAYSMFNNASSGIHFSPKYDGDPNDLASGGQVALEINISSTLTSLNCIGFMHCHTNDDNTYNTFSFSDIFAFTQLAYFSTQRQEQLALYLTTLDGGTYVMKMTSKIKMRNLYMKLLIPKDYKYYDDILDKKVDKTHTAEQQTLTFLQFLNKELKNDGIEVYEKNNSGVWEKLTLSSNKKNIVRTGI